MCFLKWLCNFVYYMEYHLQYARTIYKLCLLKISACVGVLFKITWPVSLTEVDDEAHTRRSISRSRSLWFVSITVIYIYYFWNFLTSRFIRYFFVHQTVRLNVTAHYCTLLMSAQYDWYAFADVKKNLVNMFTRCQRVSYKLLSPLTKVTNSRSPSFEDFEISNGGSFR